VLCALPVIPGSEGVYPLVKENQTATAEPQRGDLLIEGAWLISGFNKGFSLKILM
jgi:hypothetical protein